jgi:hypothetical protein
MSVLLGSIQYSVFGIQSAGKGVEQMHRQVPKHAKVFVLALGDKLTAAY